MNEALEKLPREIKYWIAVASAEHVRRGRSEGFMQVNHGKAAPLKRVKPGDLIVYYSPAEQFGSKQPYRYFTALGEVNIGEPYVGDMGPDFKPFRRDVAWRKTIEVPIAPLLQSLAFSKDNKNWGYQLRFGLFEITSADFELIRNAMVQT
jgi:EVE domain